MANIGANRGSPRDASGAKGADDSPVGRAVHTRNRRGPTTALVP